MQFLPYEIRINRMLDHIKGISLSLQQKSGVKDILKYIKIRSQSLIGDLDDIQNPEVKKHLSEFEKLFQQVLGLSESNMTQTEYGKFIIDIYQKMGLYEVFRNSLPQIKEAQFQHFLIYLVHDKFQIHLHQIYDNFVRGVLKFDFSTVYHKNPQKYDSNVQKVIYKILQDSVLTFFIQHNIAKEYQELLLGKGVLNKKKQFSKELSSLDDSYKEKIAESLLGLLENEEFGEKFFFKYLSNCKGNKSSVLIGEFNDIENDFKGISLYFVEGKNGEMNIVSGKGESDFMMNMKYFIKLLKNKDNIINLQGSISILLFCLGNIPMIGSERGYREIVQKTLSQHFPDGRYDQYIRFIQATQLTGDYVSNISCSSETEKNDYYTSFPAGTDQSVTGNIFIEALLGGGSFIQSKTQSFLENNVQKHDNVNEKEILLFLKEAYYSFEKYNFLHILDDDMNQCIQSGKLERVQKIREVQEQILYIGDDIPKMIQSLFQKYLLIKKS